MSIFDESIFGAVDDSVFDSPYEVTVEERIHGLGNQIEDLKELMLDMREPTWIKGIHAVFGGIVAVIEAIKHKEIVFGRTGITPPPLDHPPDYVTREPTDDDPLDLDFEAASQLAEETFRECPKDVDPLDPDSLNDILDQ